MRPLFSIGPAIHFAGVLSALTLFVLAPSKRQAQTGDPLPFGVGERLTFTVSTNHLNKVGEAVMLLSGPVDVRGTSTMLASFDTHVSVARVKASNESRSWIDTRDLTSLRFAKHEHRPLATEDDSVEIFPDRHHWSGAHDTGTVTSDHPLDELSFIYFLRTQSFAPDSTYSFDRHYDTRRSPTTVRVVKHETLHTPAGTFETVELEMRVRDGAEYKGEGVLYLWISDDRCRLPVRIESAMPVLGTGILVLESAVTPICRVDNHVDNHVDKRDNNMEHQ
jgi:uncharacterized protein DUF3108